MRIARPRGLFRRMPLRLKLVAAVLLLVAVALIGSGFAARATMNHYLIGRLDAQLKAAVQPIAVRGHGDPDGDHNADGDRLPSEYVTAQANAAGQVSAPTSNLVDRRQPLPRFPQRTGAQSKAAGLQTFTVHAVRGGDQWRMLAEATTLSDGSTGTLYVAQNLDEVGSTVNRLTVLLLIIGAAAMVVIAAVGYFVVRASLRPLRAVERTAAQIAGGDLSHRVPDADPHTEVGQLAGALNTMLTEIETAFAERAASENRMRTFVADASHELRTPLTTIRGFAELYRQGAVADEDDVRRVMRRIEGEATRMGVLVEDLLLLARLDQERPLARQPVDLLALCTDAVHDAQAVAPDRQITLVVGATDPPPVVTGDDARLRQVLTNLLGNAAQYTPTGSPITVGLDSDPHALGGPAAVITVTDHGPGLSADAAEHVFERFYRADAARNRNDGGTGLGLAIVAALVSGHGGTVDVRTAPGSGACFRVVLPLAAVPSADSERAASPQRGVRPSGGSVPSSIGTP